MVLLTPMSFLILIALAVGVAWWWLSRVDVSPPPVAVMPTRIAFPGGLQLDNPDASITLIQKPDEIVIPFEHAILVIDWPLTNPARISITAPITQGFTRRELVRAICDEYSNVYEAEDGTAATKSVPLLLRAEGEKRNRTDGVYGIWGHDLSELRLTAVRWTRLPQGTVEIELHVEGEQRPMS
jgi:hypothetical protein